jgi:exopolysaccharide biosynthesis protein
VSFARPLVLVAALVSAHARADAAVDWRPSGPGAERATLDVEGASVLLLRFALATHRARVVVGAGAPPRPQTAAEAARAPGVIAAVNGGFFDEHLAPLGLRVADGKVRAPLRPKADWGVLLIDDQRARIVHTTELRGAVTARQAVQVGPRLLTGGAPFPLKPQRARRTAVALDRDGSHLTLVLADTPVDAATLARALAEAGFDTAMMLDGGPSTQLALRAASAQADIPGGYPVPDLLTIVKRPASR